MIRKRRMTKEPFTDDENIVIQSGIPIRMYSGGKLAGAPSAVPPITPGDEGYVLVVIGGIPTWVPTASASQVTWKMDPVYWLRPYSTCMSIVDVPYGGWGPSGDGTGQNSGSGQLGYPLPETPTAPDLDNMVLGTDTSDTILVQFPTTLDGQTLPTARGGFDVSLLWPNSQTNGNVKFLIIVDTSSSVTGQFRIIDGTSPVSDANAYFTSGTASKVWNGANTQVAVPSGINSLRTGIADPYISIPLSGSTTWTVYIRRVSFNT